MLQSSILGMMEAALNALLGQFMRFGRILGACNGS